MLKHFEFAVYTVKKSVKYFHQKKNTMKKAFTMEETIKI